MSGNLQHDEYVSRLGKISPTTMWTLSDNGAVTPYCTVGSAVVEALIINEHTLRQEIDRVNVEIMHWGVVCARQRRCWQVREREYRQWKAAQELAIRESLEKAGKKPTEAMVEANYRTAPEYGVVSARVEEAEEAFNVSDAIYRAFKSKAECLQADVRRAPDGSLQRMSP